MRVLIILLVATLAGCASNPEARGEMTSLDALERAQAFMANEEPEAILMSLSAQWFSPDDIPDYIEEYGFRWDVGDLDITDGTANAWLAQYAIYAGNGRLPDTITVQVSRYEVLSYRSEGAVLSGSGDGAGHHGPEDICFTSASTRETFEALDLLGDAEIADATVALSQVTIPTDFFAAADPQVLTLDGARSSYGNVNDGYWCYEPVGAWTLGAYAEDQLYQASFTPAGELIRVRDWSDATLGNQVIEHDWVVTTGPLDVGSTQTRAYEMEIDVDAFSLYVNLRATGSRQTTDQAFTLTAPSGAIVEPWSETTSSTSYSMQDFERGTYTATYSFTAGLPVGDHVVNAELSYYGPPPV